MNYPCEVIRFLWQDNVLPIHETKTKNGENTALFELYPRQLNEKKEGREERRTENEQTHTGLVREARLAK